LSNLNPAARDELERQIIFARNLRIPVSFVSGPSPAGAVAEYARKQKITQIFVTRHAPELTKLVRHVNDMQVTIVAERVRSRA
jgi:two-component system, OmpR family, sensor histidine kinase KdpD